ISLSLENFINNKVIKFFSYKKLKLIRMWFVITKNFGNMKKHSHLNSDLSAVFYLKVDKATDYKSGLKIHNVLKNIEIYNYSDKKKLFKKTTNKNKSFIIKPKRNDLIILNSYIEHSVVNKNSKIVDRISLPFDLVF
ncbi:2OG-Fe(II) oxygenase family protein, partial [Candidatus Pelagibacter sp.]|nr:2OG-Fe(II) oxygenase family protein [Candidatus Pelagibacter sp.]